MSELTDVLRQRYRHTLVEKIEATIEAADPEVADAIRRAFEARPLYTWGTFGQRHAF